MKLVLCLYFIDLSVFTEECSLETHLITSKEFVEKDKGEIVAAALLLT